jgi:hypothetical protein
MAAVASGDKWGYIDKSGGWIIPPYFDGALEFHDELAPARLKNRWGYIDKRGAWVIKNQYEYAQSFKNGVAAVKLKQKDRVSYINTNGKSVATPKTNQNHDEDKGAAFSLSPFSSPSGAFGYKDASGKPVIPPIFDTALPFREGKAAVSKNGRWWYIAIP